MKYMTFNSSCSYAGVANMLEQYGVDTDDRSIAMGMKLPYLFARKDGTYMAGPMLQSAEWFNLYLHPIGIEMVEQKISSAQAAEYLRLQKTAMLGLRVDDTGKHAVVYIGSQGDALTFINNKWECTDAPEQVTLTEAQLMSQLGETAVIATLRQTAPKVVDLHSRLENSITVIRQNLAEIRDVCSHEESVGQLRTRMNTLFRPLLLDGITMLQLIEEKQLVDKFTMLQNGFLAALRQEPNQEIKLGEYFSIEELTAAAEDYIQLIRKEILA